jgi:hypothetical protein
MQLARADHDFCCTEFHFQQEADNPANGMFWQHFGLLGAVVTPPFTEHHSDISDLTQRGWFGCTLIKYPGAPFRPLRLPSYNIVNRNFRFDAPDGHDL